MGLLQALAPIGERDDAAVACSSGHALLGKSHESSKQRKLHSGYCSPALKSKLPRPAALINRSAADLHIDTIFSRSLGLFRQSPPRLSTRSFSTSTPIPHAQNHQPTLARSKSERELRPEYLKARMALSFANASSASSPQALSGEELSEIQTEVRYKQSPTQKTFSSISLEASVI